MINSGIMKRLWENERSFPDWLLNQAKDSDKEIINRIGNFLEDFDDMLFEAGTITHKFAMCQSSSDQGKTWISDSVLLPDALAYFSMGFFRYKVEALPGDYEGRFDEKTLTISVPKKYVLKDSVLLHEMIHMHELVIDALPLFYHDVITWCLYQDLLKKVPGLNAKIELHGHLLHEQTLQNYGGTHDILFLLKSFDLDLRHSYELGTVFGYGLNEELHGVDK